MHAVYAGRRKIGKDFRTRIIINWHNYEFYMIVQKVRKVREYSKASMKQVKFVLCGKIKGKQTYVLKKKNIRFKIDKNHSN